ncbi:hypothetical protein G6Z34_13020 [Clostridium perfringens]|uniref:Uncharacterized protein n=1 Tax=Clostridium perfringens TaxID=1502 RepID=A0AAP6WPV1_CLOPF|nr:hypothetical protein [Clostridium perfringens]NGU31006.1 hypothetical protein [Clostridium perfringens]
MSIYFTPNLNSKEEIEELNQLKKEIDKCTTDAISKMFESSNVNSKLSTDIEIANEREKKLEELLISIDKIIDDKFEIALKKQVDLNALDIKDLLMRIIKLEGGILPPYPTTTKILTERGLALQTEQGDNLEVN